MQNPIGEADLEWILHRNCEGTEQLQTAIIRWHSGKTVRIFWKEYADGFGLKLQPGSLPFTHALHMML